MTAPIAPKNDVNPLTLPPLNDKDFALLRLTPHHKDATSLLSGAMHLHAQCILHDHTMASFLPPLAHTRMQTYWQDNLYDYNSGLRQIILLLASTSTRTSNPSSTIFTSPSSSTITIWPTIPYPVLRTSSTEVEVEVEVAAVVILCTPPTQTGPMRSLVEKLFVSPFHRRKGFGRLVLRELEDLAWEMGRWNVMLDTEVGTGAEGFYQSCGWRRLGVVEGYGKSPRPVKGRVQEKGRGVLKEGEEVDGGKGVEWTTVEVDEVWFWKDLRRDREGGMSR